MKKTLILLTAFLKNLIIFFKYKKENTQNLQENTNNLQDKFYMYFKKEIDSEIKKEEKYKSWNI